MAAESPRKWRASRPPSIFMPSGMLSTRHRGPQQVESLGEADEVRDHPGRHDVDVDGLHGHAVEPGHVTAEDDVAHAEVVENPAQLLELASGSAGSTTAGVLLDLGGHRRHPGSVAPTAVGRRLSVAVGRQAQVVIVAVVPPLGPRRLGRPHQGRPLAVEHVMGALAGLQPSKPLNIDPRPLGHIFDGHTGGRPEALQLPDGVAASATSPPSTPSVSRGSAIPLTRPSGGGAARPWVPGPSSGSGH